MTIPTPSGLVPSTPHTPADILRLARAKIDAPEKWTQGTNARTAGGMAIEYDHPTAASFCLYGAVCSAAGHQPAGEPWEYLRRLVDIGGGFNTVSHFNDCASHGDVLNLMDEAIALAEEDA